MNSLFKYIIHILNGNKDIFYILLQGYSLKLKEKKQRQGKNAMVMNIIFL